MTKQDLERRLEEAEKQNLGLLDEIKNLKAQLAEMQDEQDIPDFPTFKPAGEEAWHINNVLDVSTPGIASETACGDFNYFHTKEMAQEFAKKCKLIAMMLHCKWYLDRDYVPDWDNHNEEKFHPLFNHDSHEFIACSYGSRFVDGGWVFFSTVENAQKCADWLNEHWKENADE